MTNQQDPNLDSPFATGAGLSLFLEAQTQQEDKLIGASLGEYQITELIAEGGMSRVYRAERDDGSFKRTVAIKLSLQASYSDDARRRFLQ